MVLDQSCDNNVIDSGHEYESIGLGECQPEFIYCDGNREVQKRCEFSMVRNFFRYEDYSNQN